MAKVIYLYNWFKKTALPLFAFPFSSLYSADISDDMKYFLLYADNKAVKENDLTSECIGIVSDEDAERIEYALSRIDYTVDEKTIANGELNVYLVAENIPNEIYNTLTIADKIIFCKEIIWYMNTYKYDISMAISKAFSKNMYE